MGYYYGKESIMNSIWTESVSMPHFDKLEGEVKTDVLIIGGGITGLLCAYFLQEKGVDYLLAEGRTICLIIIPRLSSPPCI